MMIQIWKKWSLFLMAPMLSLVLHGCASPDIPELREYIDAKKAEPPVISRLAALAPRGR